MRFHGITCIGKMILQKVTSLPAWNSGDEGRVIYETTEKKLYIGTDSGWSEAGGGGGYGLPVNNFTDNGILEAGKMYFIDTSSGSMIGNLEPNPTIGDTVTVVDTNGTFDMYSFTVDGNGHNIHLDTSLEMDVKDTILIFVYTGVSWKIDVGGIVSGGAGSSFTAEYDNDFTASAGMIAFVDTRAHEVIVTLPAENNLSTGTQVTIFDQYSTFNTNKVSVVSTQATFENGTNIIDLINDGSRTTFTWDAGSGVWKSETSSGVSGIGNVSNIDGDYDANVGDFLFINTLSGAVNITLPPSGQLSSQSVISIYDQMDNFENSPVNVTPAYGTVDGESLWVAEDSGVRVDFIWNTETEDWKLDIGGDISGVLGSGGGMGGSNPVLPTGNFTAQIGDFYFIDTSTNTVFVTMPDANILNTGDAFSIYDLKGTFSTYNVVVNAVNATVLGDGSFTADINNLKVDFFYSDEENDWKVDIGGIPVSSSSSASLPTATFDQYGLVKLATLADVTAGTSETKAVTPASLGSFTSGVIEWTFETSNFTCVKNNKYMVDTSSGPLEATLPGTPTNGDTIRFSDGGNFNVNSLTILRNGNTIEGLAEDMMVSTENMSFELVFYNNDWKLA